MANYYFGVSIFNPHRRGAVLAETPEDASAAFLAKYPDVTGSVCFEVMLDIYVYDRGDWGILLTRSTDAAVREEFLPKEKYVDMFKGCLALDTICGVERDELLNSGFAKLSREAFETTYAVMLKPRP